MIDVTDLDLRELVRGAYDLSRPQGMGIIHYQPGRLSDEEADEIIALFADDHFIAVSMDYVRGRACKFHVMREGDRLTIRDDWYDHTASDLHTLLERTREFTEAAP